MNKHQVKIIISMAMFLLSIASLTLSLSSFKMSHSVESIARKVSHTIQRRLNTMDNLIKEAQGQDYSTWLNLDNVPDDIIIYRYCADTLQSWVNEFPIINDDISSRSILPFINSSRYTIMSPLQEIGAELELATLGTEYYLLKSVKSSGVNIIAGLQLSNTLLNIMPEFGIHPLSDDGGAAVSVNGTALFKISYENLNRNQEIDATMMWISLIIMIASLFIFLSFKRTITRLQLVLIIFYAIMGTMYFVGRSIPDRFIIFSPSIYSGGNFLSSLGLVVLLNLTISISAICIYMVRGNITQKLNNKLLKSILFGAAILLSIVIIIYSYFTLNNIIMNSRISLELYKLSNISLFGIIVYASFLTLFISIPLILQTLKPFKLDFLSLGARSIWAIVFASFLVLTSGFLGYEKEKANLDQIARRLTFNRDPGLEMFLRGVEQHIADDAVVSALSVFNNTAASIQNRITENYFMRNERNYDVSVYVFNQTNNTRAAATQYRNLLEGASSIPGSSRFMYVKRDNAHSYYIGVFLYLTEGSGISRVLVRLDSRDERASRGYAAIFGITPPGQIALPQGFSYGYFEKGILKNYKGSYAYPIKQSDSRYHSIMSGQTHSFTDSGYTHFATILDDESMVVLSRASNSIMDYLVMGICLAVCAFLLISIFVINRRQIAITAKNSFRSRILIVVSMSLVATLLLMAIISVLFVYSRNDANTHNIILEKVGTITSSIETNTTDINSIDQMDWISLRRLIEKVGNDTNSDITLYSTSGKMIMSTVPMVFDMMILGDRINSEAYGQIMHQNRRYSIIRGKYRNVDFYSMYATILGGNGKPIAIICSPYNSDTFDLEEEAATHSMTIISLFLAFLIFSFIMITRVVDNLFKPLSEMSHKMSKAGLDSLEYITYDRDDEVRRIVEAYNRMVSQLSESSVQLAQAERDKAWSAMARQVAHEIKNPLTPMKLQLQRVIRLKERKASGWEERFDEAGKVILDHIDILTETANEFSNFAKLYSEDDVEINLDKLLKEEIAMFDNSDNLKFEYYGLENVLILGPKPQLTRVFVNLINNAVQALESKEDGQINVFLRKSNSDDYYDIVFEDNGPGVPDEHIDKLFTPNFTTKSAGTGLGLAISRSILDRCGASIKYSRSFTLGGACFTIRYPKSI